MESQLHNVHSHGVLQLGTAVGDLSTISNRHHPLRHTTLHSDSHKYRFVASSAGVHRLQRKPSPEASRISYTTNFKVQHTTLRLLGNSVFRLLHTFLSPDPHQVEEIHRTTQHPCLFSFNRYMFFFRQS